MVLHGEHSEYPSFLLKNELAYCSKHFESDFDDQPFGLHEFNHSEKVFNCMFHILSYFVPVHAQVNS